MAKPIQLIGRTALIAALYSDDYLPSAIVADEENTEHVYCMHSLRDGPESTTEDFISETCKRQGLDPKKPENGEPKFTLWRFSEDYPSQTRECRGCKANAALGKGIRHVIGDTREVARKTIADCA